MKWAVLGASGFIGTRFVEKLHLTGSATVRPIARSFSSLARLGRFELDWRVTDLADADKLAAALDGCEVLLHSVVGSEAAILGSIRPVYAAAQRAGVRRIVYLSSSAVHGLDPDPQTSEETPLSDRQTLAYNNAKVRAERRWQRVRQGGTVEVVGLRPSIVFGPRSRWCADVAKQALNGTAWLLGEGSGICNTIYVDNLVQAILLAAQAENVDGRYFLVRDEETVTWRQFYEPLVESCGVSMSRVHQVDAPVFFNRSFRSRLEGIRGSSFVQAILPFVPATVKRVGKAALGAVPRPVEADAWRMREPGSHPDLTEEMARLQQCRWQMPLAPAEKNLGYRPEVSFDEGMRRSIGWLKFAGYPVTLPESR